MKEGTIIMYSRDRCGGMEESTLVVYSRDGYLGMTEGTWVVYSRDKGMGEWKKAPWWCTAEIEVWGNEKRHPGGVHQGQKCGE